MDKIADDFLEVYNGAWAGHEGFKEMKRETAHKLIKSMKPVMDPRIVIFAYHEERPIGFFVCIPELNEIFKYVHGNLNWWGKLKFLWYKKMKPPRTMYGLVFGVVPDWQGKGVEGAIVVYASETIQKNGWYDDLIMTWIGDFNPKMMRINENLGATVTRKYATLRYLFDRNKPFERHPVVGKKKE